MPVSPTFRTFILDRLSRVGPDTRAKSMSAMQYYPVPADLLEDIDALCPWVDKVIDVARRKLGTRRPRGRAGCSLARGWAG